MNEPGNHAQPQGKALDSKAKENPASGKSNPTSEAQDGVKKLTPEEQMAKFEDDLKENDWGHQPC